MAAEFATPEKIAFFLQHTSGVICVPMTGDRLDELDLPLMVQRQHRVASAPRSPSPSTTATARPPASRPPTGPPPSRRSSTRPPGPDDLARPGHIFPLRYREGGVLKRAGHTEAAVDLARMAGLYPAGVLCEIVNEDKTGDGPPARARAVLPRSTACC